MLSKVMTATHHCQDATRWEILLWCNLLIPSRGRGNHSLWAPENEPLKNKIILVLKLPSKSSWQALNINYNQWSMRSPRTTTSWQKKNLLAALATLKGGTLLASSSPFLEHLAFTRPALECCRLSHSWQTGATEGRALPQITKYHSNATTTAWTVLPFLMIQPFPNCSFDPLIPLGLKQTNPLARASYVIPISHLYLYIHPPQSHVAKFQAK